MLLEISWALYAGDYAGLPMLDSPCWPISDGPSILYSAYCILQFGLVMLGFPCWTLHAGYPFWISHTSLSVLARAYYPIHAVLTKLKLSIFIVNLTKHLTCNLCIELAKRLPYKV